MIRFHSKMLLFALILLAVASLACNLQGGPGVTVIQLTEQPTTGTPGPTPTASETIPPYTPLATLTPSRTLMPPPTFEPPTPTLAPSATPSITPTSTLDLSVSIPGLHGAETATPSTTPGCEPREDWQLTYNVQRDDSLTRIAERYGTNVDELAAGNCITNRDMIVIGQELHVPGAAHPQQPEYVCTPWELLTPIDNAFNISGEGSLTFNWRGPRGFRNLVRIHSPSGRVFEEVVDLRQNVTIDLADLPEGGLYTWYVYPLDENFWQIPCLEGGPWRFTKDAAPTATPTITPYPTSESPSGLGGISDAALTPAPQMVAQRPIDIMPE